MLGRFVAPAGRLVELGRAAEAVLPEPGAGEPWRVSALLGADLHGDTARVASWNVSHSGRASGRQRRAPGRESEEAEAALDALAARPHGVRRAAARLRPRPAARGAQAARCAREAAHGRRRAEAIPDPGRRWPASSSPARPAGVPFKATAGLHHPVRAEHRLTYDSDSPRAVMHGFVNVFAAAALARDGLTTDEVEAILREDDPRAFRLDDSGLEWRGLRVATDALTGVRRDFASSFGSCSFAEPVADLRALEVLS
jgi:hypothetical protein